MSESRAIWIIVTLALLVPFAAAEFDTQLTSIDDRILPGEAAIYELEVTNSLEVPDTYAISSQEYGFILLIDPRPSEIAPGETGMFGLEVTPRDFVVPGAHVIPLRVRSIVSGNITDLEAIVRISDPNQQQGVYTPSIALSVGSPGTVDPRDDLTLNVNLRNRNARVYDSADPITVRIESDIFMRTYNTSLGPVGIEGEKTNEVRIELDPYQEPGTHPLTVQLLVDDTLVSSRTSQFEITDYSDVEQVTFEDGSLFKSTTTYRLRNDGNVNETYTLRYDINALQRVFVSASENYVLEDGDVVITHTLAPLEERTVTITENYRLLVLLIILAIASIIGYYLLRSPILISKQASVESSVDDGKSRIKVRILVRNRSSETLTTLRIVDRMSGVADIIKDNALGTLKPTKVVKKKSEGTLIRWDLDQLEPFEERIITYKVTTPLALVGHVTLPSVKVKYDMPSGRERTVHSDEVAINTKQ